MNDMLSTLSLDGSDMQNTDIPKTAATTIIHRPLGGVSGYRKVTDRASRACVHAFPMSIAQHLAASGLLASPGAYILTDGRSAYFGESGRPGHRVREHTADAGKKFCTDVYVVAGCDGSPFDRIQIIDLQFRFTNLAIEAGSVTVLKGANPPEPNASESDRTTHDRIFDDAKRLLFDAGCQVFHVRRPVHALPSGDDMSDTACDSGPMQIGVTTTPLGAAEFGLSYGDLFARGYWSADLFIVAAGSEIRKQANDSTNALTLSRRDDLLRAGVLCDIPGIDDRRRLTAAVAFPSISIAAKILCGAHTSGNRWVPLRPSRPVVLDTCTTAR